MRKLILLIGVCFGLAACGATPTAEPATPVATEIPATVVAEMPTVPPDAPYPAPGEAYPEPEPTSLINDETMRAMGDLARQRLAEELSVSVDAIVLVGADPVFWEDASLGCPQPDMTYAQVETPGYRVTLVYEGTPYIYHTDTVENIVRCETQ